MFNTMCYDNTPLYTNPDTYPGTYSGTYSGTYPGTYPYTKTNTYPDTSCTQPCTKSNTRDNMGSVLMDNTVPAPTINNTEPTINNTEPATYNNDWSASETLHQMTSASTQVNSNIFEIFISEMIRDKCWNKTDVNEFVANMQKLSELMNQKSNNGDMFAMLLNPQYYNAIYSLMDKLDTINVMCVLRTGNKCDMIKDPRQKEIIKSQVQLIGKLVDIYMPIFVRMILLLEKLVADASNEKACNLDPVYLNTLNKIKNRVVSAVYMNRLANRSYLDQAKELRMISNNGLDNSSMVQNDVLKEGFDSGTYKTLTGSTSGDYIITLIIVLIIAYIIYISFAVNK